jgi:hypothetical protein
MKFDRHKKAVGILLGLFLLISFCLAGCTNLQPTEPQSPIPSPSPSPGKPTTEPNNYTVTYSYGSTDKVQLSANNLTLKVGQKLTLQPAPDLTTNTRFTSSGENFFGDVMQQDSGQNSTKVTFTAIKPGKGKLQIIPNTDDTARATDFWVTVVQ